MDILQTCGDSPKVLDTILSSIQHIIILIDYDGNILFANPVVERVFGFTPNELKGKNLSILFRSRDLTYLYPNLLHMAKKNKPFEGEVMLMRRDKTRFFAFMVFRPCFDSRKDKSLVVVYIQDIDTQKQCEKGFRDTHYMDLVKVADGIAHELRNPLVAIGGFAKRLYKSRKADDDKKYYEGVLDNVKRLEGLVEKVEFFAHLPKPCMKEQSIRAMMKEALQPYLQQIEECKIELINEIEDVNLFVDKSLVVRAFCILIENALDALTQGGQIRICSETKDNDCRICVADTGCGISSEDIPYVFDPFFRTKPDRVGIDLAVVKRIMDSHVGSVEVTSKQGQGTTFFLVFPLERRRSIRVCRLGD
ncbi:MAG: PAS domain S-box protein [Deltaproteobacteria bacterium]|nr:PAS domain S-box protein [Deltaproteobacteria bacterium]